MSTGTYLDDVEESEAEIADRRTPLQFPTVNEDGRTWSEYFADYRRGIQEGELVVPPLTRTVVGVDLSPSEAGLGRSVRSVLDRLRDAGWERVGLHSSLVALSDEFYADDAQKKPGEEVPKHRKGELKKPAHEVRYWWLHAAHPPARVGLRASWKEGVTAKGGRSFTFESAICADPLGMPRELFFDYTPSANDLKQVKDEPGWAHAQRVERTQYEARQRDLAYNTGTSRLERRPAFEAFGEFEAWLAEAIEITSRTKGASLAAA